MVASKMAKNRELFNDNSELFLFIVLPNELGERFEEVSRKRVCKFSMIQKETYHFRRLPYKLLVHINEVI